MPSAEDPSDDQTASISGRIYRADTGEALAGAAVTALSRRRPFSAELTAITGPDGAFAIPALSAGEYYVQAKRNGFISESYKGTLTLAAGTSANAGDLALRLASVISGSVYDQEGDPIQGMKITLNYRSFLKSSIRYRSLAGEDAITDDQGNFRVAGMEPGECYAVASTVGDIGNAAGDMTYYPSADSAARATPITLKPGLETSGIRITLSRPLPPVVSPANANSNSASISGRVFHAETNAPLEGALVFLYRIPNIRLKQPGPFWPKPAMIARTDASGSYGFESLEPDRYGIEVQRAGFLRTGAVTAPDLWTLVAKKKPIRNLDAHLRPAAAITGTLRDANNMPLEGLSVSVVRRATPEEKGDFMRVDSPTTDDRGQYRAPVAPGDYYVTAGPSPAGFGSLLQYRRVYYPDAARPGEAQTIHVDVGSPAVVDLQLPLNSGPRFALSVKPVGKGAGDYHMVSIEEGGSAERAFLPGINLGVMSPRLAAPGQTVQFRGVPPGTFTIAIGRANVKLAGDGSITSVDGGLPDKGSKTIQVVASDLRLEIATSR